MKQLELFNNYKSQLMKDLLTNEDLVKLINETVETGQERSLAYSQIFPFEYIPETLEEGKTFICFDVDIEKSYGTNYLRPLIYIWIFTHQNNLRLPEGGVRVDRICSEIADMINGSHYYGLGELELESIKRFAPVTNYNGKVMKFSAFDYNKCHQPSKPYPANRFEGK